MQKENWLYLWSASLFTAGLAGTMWTSFKKSSAANTNNIRFALLSFSLGTCLCAGGAITSVFIANYYYDIHSIKELSIRLKRFGQSANSELKDAVPSIRIPAQEMKEEDRQAEMELEQLFQE